MVSETLNSLAEAIDGCLVAFGATVRNSNHRRVRYPAAKVNVEDLATRTLAMPGDGRSLLRVASNVTSPSGVHIAIEALAEEAVGATVEIQLNGMTLCKIESGVTATNTYDALRAGDFDPDDVVEILTYLDKRRFLDELGARASTHCFVNGAALSNFLSQPTGELAVLWPVANADEPTELEVALVHTPSSVAFDGELLRIGSGLEDARTPDAAAAVAKAKRFAIRGGAPVASSIDFGRITPVHFERRSESDEEPAELHRHLANVTLVYLCDSARGSSEFPVVSFRSGGLHASVEIPVEVSSYPAELARLCNWVYQRPSEADAADPYHDRLAVAQTTLTRDLQPVELNRRFNYLMGDDRRFFSETLEAWRSYVGDKIDAHTGKRIELENDVSAAVAEYGARTDELVADLSKAMAGAVAAVITSFVGAAFSETFDSSIFRIGLGSYLVYLALFPGVIRLAVYRARQSASEADVATRLNTFTGPLGKIKVKQVVGDRVKSANWRFVVAFRVAAGAYVAVTFAGVLALLFVPSIISTQPCDGTHDKGESASEIGDHL